MAANETETDAGATVAAARVAEMLEAGDAQVIDVREGYEHDAGHIPGSQHIEVTDLTAAAERLDRDRPVVFYCRSGDRSTMPAEAYRASGWDAYTLEGGLAAWAGEGLPLEPADGRVAERRPGPQT
jgi:rhodanese-related sulfurtransferase